MQICVLLSANKPKIRKKEGLAFKKSFKNAFKSCFAGEIKNLWTLLSESMFECVIQNGQLLTILDVTSISPKTEGGHLLYMPFDTGLLPPAEFLRTGSAFLASACTASLSFCESGNDFHQKRISRRSWMRYRRNNFYLVTSVLLLNMLKK